MIRSLYPPIRFALLFLVILAATPGLAQTADSALTISNISLDKKTFRPPDENAVVIGFSVSEDTGGAVRIYNDRDVRVRILAYEKTGEAGRREVQWDGRDDEGRPLPGGAYIYTIEAASEGGERAVYDPADATGGNPLEVRKPILDMEKKEVSYVMPKAGRVRIRAGIQKGPLLRTLIDWEPREAGRNAEPWDGTDESGLIDLFKIPERELFIFAYSLPDNSIILSPSPAWAAEAVPAETPGADPVYRPKKPVESDEKYFHALHDRSTCHEPEFDVRFPADVETTAEGVPIVSGVVPVTVAIAEKDRRHLESERFEVMFFVDTRFIFEDEEGFTPFRIQN